MRLKPLRGLASGCAFAVLVVGGIVAGVVLQWANVVALLAARLFLHRRSR